MSEISKLKKSRAAMRRAFTLAVKKVEDLFKEETVDLIQVSAQLEVLNTHFFSLNELNSSIYDKILEDDEARDEEIDEELQGQSEYSVQYHTVCKKVEQLKNNEELHQEVRTEVTQRSSCSISESCKAGRSYKLPYLKLKEFNGELGEWLPFWSQFKKIDEDQNVDPADKIQYLIMATLTGSPARELVESYPATPEMYSEVVQALKSRFGRDDLLKEYYMRQMLSLAIQNVTSTEKPPLSVLYDKIQSHLRNLNTLGVTSEHCASLLFPMVTSSLPEDILKLWQRTTKHNSNTHENSSKEVLDNLLTFLKNEVEGEQKVSMALEGFGVSSSKHDVKHHTNSYQVSRGPPIKTNKCFDKQSSKGRPFDKQPSAAALMTTTDVTDTLICVFCEKNHRSQDCIKALEMTLHQRKDILKKKGACFKCLKFRHLSNSCKALIKCAVCLRKHYPITCEEIHNKNNTLSSNDTEKSNERKPTAKDNSSQALVSSISRTPVVYLSTLVVKLIVGNQEHSVRALIDSGSQKSYITKSCTTDLKLKRLGKTLTSQELFGGHKTSLRSHGIYSVKLKSTIDGFEEDFKVLDTTRICGFIPKVTDVNIYELLKSKGVILSDFSESSEEISDIQLLLGADSWPKLITSEYVKMSNELAAVKTKLGWTLVGESDSDSKSKWTSSMLLTLTKQVDLSHFWELELLGIKDPGVKKIQSEKDKEVAEFFENTVQQEDSGRYVIKLPWSEGKPVLENNKSVAEKRLYLTTKKLNLVGKYNDYDSVFDSWLKLEIIEKVPDDELNKDNVHYLPHRPVFKENSTTKVRPVFDASAVDSNGHSLNNSMEKGPNLIEQIPFVLTKFRQNAIGVIADIEKAFLQISVCPDDRDWLRFLWWKNGKIVTFRHRRVVFGVTSSPFLLGAVLSHHIRKAPEHLKETSEKLAQSLYVDNCVTSVESVNDLDKFVSESQQLLNAACFNLRGWVSNLRNPDTEENVLGLRWNCGLDTLSCNLKLLDGEPTAFTRRTLLSTVQRIYDPIGFTMAVSITLKILLQKSWDKSKEWDDPLPEDLVKNFKKWLAQVHLLNELKITRRCIVNETSSLHIFCDASKSAYACCIFIRTRTEEGITLSLLMAKSRVAPTKALTLPRLELMAALIGTRLYSLAIQGLERNITEVIFWTDSTVVLTWIHKKEQWSVFVQNRVKEIVSVSSPQQWRHIPGTENPADLISRGCLPAQLIKSRWCEGPTWLSLPEHEWPIAEITPDVNEANRELKKSANLVAVAKEENLFSLSILAQDLGSYPKIVRTMARVLDFICLMSPDFTKFCGLTEDMVLNRVITSEKYINAEIVLIRTIQKEFFCTENGIKTLNSLNTFKDDCGLIHLKTRLMEGEDSPNFVSPIFLPSSHLVIDRLIEHEHLKNNHAGVLTLILILRERFWIPKCRRKVKTVVHRCLTCKKLQIKPLDVPTPPLPRERTQSCPVFQTTGIDLMGPLFLNTGEKCWIIIFTCAVYRAVHLELLVSQSTSALIQALRRFISRRGRPKTIHSDNGTNFVGLNNAFNDLDWNKIEEECSFQRIKWKFNAPSAPWWGGYWERLIRVLKDLLKKNLGKASLGYEELMTLVCECECLMNNRPLTYISDNPNELTPLSPSLFISSLPNSEMTDFDELETKSLQKRLRFLQKLRNGLQIRFHKEYLGFLRTTKKRQHDYLSVGDVVLVGSDKKRLEWIMARVTELIPGRDGVVRLVRLRTSRGEILRPIQRLYPLEINSQDNLNLEPEMTQQNALTDYDEPTTEDQEEVKSPPQDPNQHKTTRSGREVKTREILDL